MKNLIFAIAAVSVALLLVAVPIILVFDFEKQLLGWLDSENTTLQSPQIAFLIFGLLASDVVLPVPSSGIMTFAGAKLGFVMGVLVCWLAMDVSVVIAYWLSRSLGKPFVRRFAKPESAAQASQWLEKNGTPALAILRCVPVLAEASVIVAGLYQMNFAQVAVATFLANLAIVAVYCGVGYVAEQSGWLTTAIVVSLLVPLAFYLFLKPLKKSERIPTKS